MVEGDKRYGRTGVLKCQACRSHVAIVAAYIGNGILVLVYLTFSIHLTLEDNQETVQSPHSLQDVQASELLRVSVSFVQ